MEVISELSCTVQYDILSETTARQKWPPGKNGPLVLARTKTGFDVKY